MNIRDAIARIGQSAHVRTEDALLAPVVVVDAKEAWGRLRFVVEQRIGVPGHAVYGGVHKVTVDAARVLFGVVES